MNAKVYLVDSKCFVKNIVLNTNEYFGYGVDITDDVNEALEITQPNYNLVKNVLKYLRLKYKIYDNE